MSIAAIMVASGGVAAFAAASAPSSLSAITPCRLLDTRAGAQAVLVYGQPVSSAPYTIQVTGNCGVPQGATAVSGILTATGESGPGWAKLWPADAAAPSTSNINFYAGTDVANSQTVGLSPGGQLTMETTPGITSNLIFDVTGYYTPSPSGSGGTTYHAATGVVIDGTNGIGLGASYQLPQNCQPGQMPTWGMGSWSCTQPIAPTSHVVTESPACAIPASTSAGSAGPIVTCSVNCPQGTATGGGATAVGPDVLAFSLGEAVKNAAGTPIGWTIDFGNFSTASDENASTEVLCLY